MDCVACSEGNILKNMEDTVKIFVLGFKKWAKLNKVNQTKIGKVVGKVQTTVSDYWNGISRPSMDMIEKWVEVFSLDYEEILNAGREELKKENRVPTQEEIRRIIREERLSEQVESADNQKKKPLSEKITKYTNPIVIKHQELITRFPDPEKALELNSLAVYLSELEPKEIDKAIDYLKERITFNEAIKGINKPPDKKASIGEH